MPGQPSPSDAHVDAILTNISVAFMQSLEVFAATTIFPIVPVDNQSDLYYTYNRDDWFREEARKRAPSAESAGSGYELATSSYRADVWAVHKDVSDQLRSNADSVINLDRDATEWVTRQLLMRLEAEFVSTFFTTSVWTGAATGNDQTGVAAAPGADQFTQWNDASSTPIEDITELKDEMQQKTGFMPNTLLLGPQVATALKNHPDIIDRIKHVGVGKGTMAILADLFDMDKVVEARSTRNTAVEGATDSYSFYFGKNALLAYAAPSASLMQPSAGYTWSWTGYTGTSGVSGLGTGMRMSRLRMDHLKSDRIEGELAFDQTVVAADLGIFFTSAVA